MSAFLEEMRKLQGVPLRMQKGVVAKVCLHKRKVVDVGQCLDLPEDLAQWIGAWRSRTVGSS